MGWLFLTFMGLVWMIALIPDATVQILAGVGVLLGSGFGFVLEKFWPWSDPPSIGGKGMPPPGDGGNLPIAVSTSVPVMQAP